MLAHISLSQIEARLTNFVLCLDDCEVNSLRAPKIVYQLCAYICLAVQGLIHSLIYFMMTDTV